MTEIDTAQSKTQSREDGQDFDFEEYVDPRIRCAGVARNGRQCKVLVQPEAVYCHQHADACGQYGDPLAAIARALHNQQKRGAAVRGIAYRLRERDVYRMLKDSRGRCAVTFVPFSYEKTPGQKKRPYYPSIDRIDPAGDYRIGNVRLVIAAANLAMNVWGDEVLHRMAQCMVDAGVVVRPPGS